MSQAPYAVRNARWGSPLGVDLKVYMYTSCFSHLISDHVSDSQGAGSYLMLCLLCVVDL